MGGINECCQRVHKFEEKSASQNEGETFISQIFLESKMKDLDFNTFFKIFIGEQFNEVIVSQKSKFLIDVAKFANRSITYLYEPDIIKNPYANIQACFFSYTAVLFSKQISKVDIHVMLRMFLAFLRNSHQDKMNIFCSLNYYLFENKTSSNYEEIRIIVREYLIFLLHNITHEIGLTIFNEINKYREILKDINILCKIFNEKNIDFFLDNIILDSNVYKNSNIDSDKLKEIWNEKVYLFDFFDLRTIFLSHYQNPK